MARFTGTGGGSGSGAPGPMGATGPQGLSGANGFDGAAGLDGAGFEPQPLVKSNFDPFVGFSMTLLGPDNPFLGAWSVGSYVRVINSVNTEEFFEGTITEFTPGGVVVTILISYVTDTWTREGNTDVWTMILAGSRGAAGPAGADGSGSGGSGFNFRGAYEVSPTVPYTTNDLVTFYNASYVLVTESTEGNHPISNVGQTNTNWQLFTPSSPNFKGEWDYQFSYQGNGGGPGYVYVVGDVVSRNGTLYIGSTLRSIINGYPVGWGDPSGDPSVHSWEVFVPEVEGFNWRGTWESLPLTSYLINDIVEANGTSYIALTNNSGFNPVDAPFGHWDIFSAAGKGFHYRGVFDPMGTYEPLNDVVSYLGALYISSNESGSSFSYQTPGYSPMSGNSSYWDVLVPAAAGLNYRGTWSSRPMGAYVANDVVVYGGGSYVARTLQAGMTYEAGTGTPGTQSGWGVLSSGFSWKAEWTMTPMMGDSYAAGDVVSYGANVYVAYAETMGSETPGTGTPGDMMMNGWQKMLSGFNWRGAWSSMPMGAYLDGDIVSHNGSSYIANLGMSGSSYGTPGDSDSYGWNLLSAKGDTGSSGTSTETSFVVAGGTTGTQPTFDGAPLFSGTYVLHGPLVHFQIQVSFSNITSFGTGQYYVDLPFPAKYGYQVTAGCVHDISEGKDYIISGHVLAGSSQLLLKSVDASGNTVFDVPFTSTSPATLAIADNFHISGDYIFDENIPTS